MKKLIKMAAAVMGAVVLMLPTKAAAQNEFTVNGKIDFVSDYVWRGAYQNSGVSIQPSLTLGYAGLTLNFWGNQSLENSAKEFDINLGYTINNFSITVSDYWWSGVDMPYGHYENQHFFEGTLAYCFGESFPLTLSWSTMFAGGDKDEDGDLQGSTYINASYPISLPLDITLTPSVGFTPWKGMYHDKAAFTDISLKASKDIKVNDRFSIPLFVQAIVSPVYDRTYLVGGFSLGF
ncbi:TorF family putative porin [uncultured Bacteroides sp.]|uniref:TorF family putative porin n=1 Tax=uncultured Bacteroides sp. TaxID=162156 RepID=UPI00260EA211|nr:TorF family putative porin [uncultured Bacteroides sp.]